MSFSSKINAKIQNFESKNNEKNEAQFFAVRNDLPLDFIGSEFVMEGVIFKITKLVTSQHKYPIIAHNSESGKTLKFTVHRIKELLEKYRVIDISYQDVEQKQLHD